MWELLTKFILRMRIPILGAITVLTVFMAIQANKTELQWDLPRLLPDHDSTLLNHQRFEKMFGSENLSVILGIEQDPLKDQELYNKWGQLRSELQQIEGVDTVVSVNNIPVLHKNTEKKKIEFKPAGNEQVSGEDELEEIRNKIYSLPFYKGKLYSDTTDIGIMAVTLNPKIFNAPSRVELMDSISAKTAAFQENNNLQLHYSGLPYIRNETTNLIKSELTMFVYFAAAVTIIILIIFFRSFPPVFVSMLIVLLGVIWSLGLIATLGYKITILSSIIPPLIIVIGIPNSVYLINKYHAEYSAHGNKVLALTRIIKKIGKATLMTNITTAIGFATFIFTQSNVLVEFGIIASINILLLFTLSIFMVPGILSFLKPPKKRHTKHLEKPRIRRTVELLVKTVTGYRKEVYIITAALIVISVFGLLRIGTSGNLVDDLPQRHPVVKDLRFLENKIGGVMPFEVIVDTKKEGKASQLSTHKKMDRLQSKIDSIPQLSGSTSIVNGLKFVRQAFFGGNPEQYKMISRNEQVFIKPYLPESGNGNMISGFVDSTARYARISVRMKDIGSKEMQSVVNTLRAEADQIFDSENYKVTFAGSTLTYLKGTTYLIRNLFLSLALAIFIISLLMAALFSSFRMIAMSIITNLIPLLLTAAIMGYFGIPVKPSTILIFSIAFGISIDDTIHFLAKYRQELNAHNWNVRVASISAIRETGISMIYTSIILLCGFSVFATSQFGGTQAMGILVSITLLIAMIANLVLLPSFLLSMDRSITTKAFKEPFMEIWDEEADIDYDALKVEKSGSDREDKKQES